jgi:sec-independent protein translocase protein TatA
MGGLSITHWLIVLLVVILLFGARRLPDTARGLARSLRIFKSEINEEDSAGARQQAPANASSAEPTRSWPMQSLNQTAPQPAAPQPAAAMPAAAVEHAAVPVKEPGAAG